MLGWRAPLILHPPSATQDTPQIKKMVDFPRMFWGAWAFQPLKNQKTIQGLKTPEPPHQIKKNISRPPPPSLPWLVFHPVALHGVVKGERQET